MKYKYLTIAVVTAIAIAFGFLHLAEIGFMLMCLLFLYWIIATLIRKSHSGKIDPILVLGWVTASGFVGLIGWLVYRIIAY